MSNHVTALHNYLQNRKEEHLISYAEKFSGLSSQAIWTVECKVADVVKGVGVAPQKATARQEAAKKALEVLKG